LLDVRVYDPCLYWILTAHCREFSAAGANTLGYILLSQLHGHDVAGA
jgi:hypothetical protein